MKKKPAINLLKTPQLKKVGKSSFCWRCGKKMTKNDPVFEIPGDSKISARGHHYREKTRYCQNCIKDSIIRTERGLNSLKKKTG